MVWTRCYKLGIFQDLVNLSNLSSGYFDESTKKMIEDFFWEKWNINLAEKTKASYSMTETSIVQRVAYILASLWWRMVFVSILSSEKNQIQVEKYGKNSEKIFITLIPQKNPERKKFRRHF